MRVHRFLLFFARVLPSVLILTRALICLIGLISFSLRVQAQSSTTPSAQKDPQAITILSQAMATLGGAVAISAIKDYSGTGTMVFHQSPTEQVNGTVTVSGLGIGEFRMDSNLSTGTRSYSISQDGRTNRKREDGTVSHFPPVGPIPSSDAFPYVTPIFPSGTGFPNEEAFAAVNSPELNVSYKGLVQLDGRSVHDIQVQRGLTGNPNPNNPMSQYNTMDFFIDASTLQIAMTQDTVPKGIVHQIRYSDYRPVRGISVPFSISEQMAGQHTWDIQLNQIVFNNGLQDSDFTL
jgi:hypothetical protein